MKEVRDFDLYPDYNLESAFSTVASSELGLDILSGKSVYYFGSDVDLTQPDKAGVVPLDFISKMDSDSVIIVGENTGKRELEGSCALLVVIKGKLDFGITSTFKFGYVEEPNGKLRKKIFYPRSNTQVASHIPQVFESLETFIDVAKQYACTVPLLGDAIGHRIISREFPLFTRRINARTSDKPIYH